MTTALHQGSAHVRSVHIAAPVTEVFEYVKDPHSFVAADPEPVRLSEVSLTPEGIGSSWCTSWHVFGLPFHAAVTREELVPNERIVDHASTGVTWTYTTTPEGSGTTLSLGYAISTRVRVANKILDRIFRNQEQQFDKMLASYKQAIEALGRTGPMPGHQ